MTPVAAFFALLKSSARPLLRRPPVHPQEELLRRIKRPTGHLDQGLSLAPVARNLAGLPAVPQCGLAPVLQKNPEG